MTEGARALRTFVREVTTASAENYVILQVQHLGCMSAEYVVHAVASGIGQKVVTLKRFYLESDDELFTTRLLERFGKVVVVGDSVKGR